MSETSPRQPGNLPDVRPNVQPKPDLPPQTPLFSVPVRIYLTGFMGSGKSTVGPILANVLGASFLDLDVEIAAMAGRRIAQLFDEEGEAAFRARERQALEATASRSDVVVATGGGALVQPGAMAWAKRHGTVVYLRVPAAALAARLAHARVVRPLMLDPDGQRLDADAIEAKVQTMLDVRGPIYETAHVVVEPDARGVGYTVDAVARALRLLGDVA